MKRQRHTVKELMAAKREAHRIVAEKLRNETFYQASSLVMRFVLGIIEDHQRKGTTCQQDCDGKTRSAGSKPS